MSGGLGYKRFYGGIAYWYFRCAGSYLAALPGRPSLQDVEKSLDDSEKRMMEKMHKMQVVMEGKLQECNLQDMEKSLKVMQEKSLQDMEKSLDDSEKRMMEKMQQLQAENNRLLIAEVLKAVQQQSPKLAFDP